MMGLISGEEELCRLRALFTLSFLDICNILRKRSNAFASGERPSDNRTAAAPLADGEITLIRIINFITNRYRTPLTLRDVADGVGLSGRQVQRTLSVRMGESFTDILSRYRINAACSMLEDASNASMTLEQISYACGYSNYVSFWSQFKRITALTPEQYRSTQKNK